MKRPKKDSSETFEQYAVRAGMASSTVEMVGKAAEKVLHDPNSAVAILTNGIGIATDFVPKGWIDSSSKEAQAVLIATVVAAAVLKLMDDGYRFHLSVEKGEGS